MFDLRTFEYSCPRCGNYFLVDCSNSRITSSFKNDDSKIARISHWIRSKHESIIRDELSTEKIILTQDLLEKILKNPLPTPAEQADNVVRWLGSKSLGERITVKPLEQMSIMGAETVDGFELVLDALLNQKHFLKGKIYRSSAGLGGDITLSFEGWQYYEKLKKGASESRKAFMAMEYGDTQLDGIVENTFKPAVKQTGFDLIRLDDRPKAGLLDDRLRVEIRTSRFLIADLTHNNLGAYWEAGYAEGLGKPVIYTCDKKVFDNPETKPHFDTNHHLTIPWDENNLQEAAEKLKTTIRATLPEAAKLTDD